MLQYSRKLGDFHPYFTAIWGYLNMIIERQAYLNKLISRKENNQIKVITGIRRCGKSFLLFNIYYDYLISIGVSKEQIITVTLDDDSNAKYRNPKSLSKFIHSCITDDKKVYYIFIDEIQYAILWKAKGTNNVSVFDVLNGLLRLRNVDIYVTGSNSKMLSKDVMTEFRGRGDNVEVFPLSFKEYYEASSVDLLQAYEQYAKFGGMPLILSKNSEEEKATYLSSLFKEVYFKDIVERYKIELPDVLEELTECLCSSIGSLTNINKITKTLKSVKRISVNNQTIANYLLYLEEAFLFRRVKRFDIKGKKYFEYPSKYYCIDIGLRNSKLNYRQQDEGYIMENIIYNELVKRGYSVDIGVVDSYENDENQKTSKRTREIDYIINKGDKKYYIQSAVNLYDEEKERKEILPLLLTNDFFKKVIITKSTIKQWQDERGIVHQGLYDFLLDEDCLDK